MLRSCPPLKWVPRNEEGYLSGRNRTDPATGGRLPRLAREVAVFVAAAAVFGDLLVTGLDVDAGSFLAGQGPLLDVWDAGKATAVAAGMLVVAWRARSFGSAVLGALFVLIGIQDQLAWHGRAGRFLSDTFQFDALQRLVPAGQAAWGEFLVLTALAVVGGTLVWTVRDRWPGFRSARKVLTLLLIVLFGFAGVVDLLGASTSNTTFIAVFEETGERLALSVISGYVAGLVVTVVRTPPAGR